MQTALVAAILKAFLTLSPLVQLIIDVCPKLLSGRHAGRTLQVLVQIWLRGFISLR